jgi:nicotinate-nucleotide pyrophosphorylase (carboxylating)
MNLVARIVREALLEDVGPGDLTCEALIDPTLRARAVIVAREPLVLAGLEPASIAFRLLDPGVRLSPAAQPGDSLESGAAILEVRGAARAILGAERTALNFLGRLSGIASITRRCVDAVRGTPARIYDTRKTTPGQRVLERDAVARGGGHNHRLGLWDAVLIKDNHLVLHGGPQEAVRAARTCHGPGVVVEVEIDRIEDLEPAIEAGADIVLLDNFPIEEVERAVLIARAKGGDRVALEASGGINLENIAGYAAAGIDRISLGMITHSAPSSDVSLEMSPASPAG